MCTWLFCFAPKHGKTAAAAPELTMSRHHTNTSINNVCSELGRDPLAREEADFHLACCQAWTPVLLEERPEVRPRLWQVQDRPAKPALNGQSYLHVQRSVCLMHIITGLQRPLHNRTTTQWEATE